VILIWGTDPAALTANVNALFVAADSERKISGSLTVVREAQVSTLLSEKTYTVGDLRWYQQSYWFVASHWRAFAVLLGLVCLVLLSLSISAVLNIRARTKL
jgi:hypothetical protein